MSGNRPRTFKPTGDVVTVDDLVEFVRELERDEVPGESVIRARPAMEINLQHGARIVAITAMPTDER